jgi:hypothetical protein
VVPKEGDRKSGYRVRWIRKVMVSRVQGLDFLVLETCRKIASEVAASEETRGFVRAREVFSVESGEFAVAREKMRQKFKDVTAEAWENVEGFAKAVDLTVEEGMEEYIWASIPMRFSHDIEGCVTEDEQRWYVD